MSRYPDPGRGRRAAVRTLARIGALCCLAGAAAGASAQAWPTRPIRLIVPAAPGGSADPLARLAAEELGRTLQQSVIVENRPGANGNLGSAFVVKSPADGYTLLFGWSGTVVTAATLYQSKPYNPQRDLDAIVTIGSVPNVILVHPSIPASTIPELTAYARQNPGQLNFGSTGSGSSYHLSGELYNKTQGVSMVHVPYTSPGAVLTDLMAGRLQLAFPGVVAAAPFVHDGKLRALAVMSDKRSSVLPEVPTTAEAGFPALTSDTWFGLFAPKNTPPEVRARINEAINNALKDPGFRGRLTTLGYTPLGGTQEQFAQTLGEDIRKWGEVVRFSGAKID
ncbi:tripartite tricarboxylate transporter substrate binding protein [Xylophilus rhododendri]|uniref:Tripartite tricarboxylate transporter substrate binding protein n=1 Tax=Xylophilus rhododendri TaxID=2697032 RepID=A0A857J3N7_9BURK|nr:tripartite tricarboxylate transporter substrate binding protein [Xylophilus rhododendri]QHI97475.1 tripartite tricarboxylate transporter substrate binding protein [Xylophilus rhododendri]